MRWSIFACAFIAQMLISSGYSYSQCKDQWWTNDEVLKASAAEHLVHTKNAISLGEFRNAEVALQWLYMNAPGSGGEIFTLGIHVYDTLAELERDSDRRKIYVDSLMVVYDLQTRYCGSTDAFTAKVLSFYKFNSVKNPEEALKLFDSLLTKQGNNISNEIVIAYMQTVKRLFAKKRKLADDQILSYYNRSMHIAEYKQRQASRKGISEEPFLRLKDNIDALLFSMIVVDCNFVKKNLAPRFRQHPEDLTLARKIISFMMQNQCVDDPLWLDAGERLYRSSTEKDFSLAKSIGLRYFTLERFDKAESFFKDAVSIAPTARDKGEMLLYFGRIRARSDKAEARKLFLEILQIDKGNKEAYERIGDLYYNSADDCTYNTNIVENQLVYFLAAEYFQRSGNDQKVAMARNHFPTKAELASTGYVNGSEKFVGCWIQEPTTIRTKD
ncbi:MAG: hypothetical protein ABJA70_16930 [Chryseolinea sp.]